MIGPIIYLVSIKNILGQKLILTVIHNSCLHIFVYSKIHIGCKIRTTKHHWTTNTCPCCHCAPQSYRHLAPSFYTWPSYFKTIQHPLQCLFSFFLLFNLFSKSNIKPSLWSRNTLILSPNLFENFWIWGEFVLNQLPTDFWFSNGLKLFNIFIGW